MIKRGCLETNRQALFRLFNAEKKCYTGANGTSRVCAIREAVFTRRSRREDNGEHGGALMPKGSEDLPARVNAFLEEETTTGRIEEPAEE